VDGTPLAAGKTARIDATVWVFSTASDFLDLFFAPDASAASPVWTPLGTLLATSLGLQTVSTTFVLPDGPLPVIRANWRFIGTAGSCTPGSFDDRDDLVFKIGRASCRERV